MNKLKTSELTGATLDWAVAKCEGIEWWAAEEPKDGLFIDYERTRLYSPSSDWSQGGPLIAQHIFLLEDLGDYEWGATAANGCKCRGDTVLQAVCRAYVLATLGEEVEIPNELEAPQPVKRQPLTDEEICAALDIDGADDWTFKVAYAAIAAYERKNGVQT